MHIHPLNVDSLPKTFGEVWVEGPHPLSLSSKDKTPWQHAIGVLEFLSWFKT